MRTLLLGCVAALTTLAVPAASAQAESSAEAGVNVHRGFDRDHGDRDHRDHRRDRRRANTAVVLDLWGGGYDDSYNGRAFSPDSYNDWWHERPDRSYPRWMQNNRNCERQWWSGGGWTC